VVVTHLVGERPAMDESRVERRAHLSAVLRGDVDEIAEDVVVPDLSERTPVTSACAPAAPRSRGGSSRSARVSSSAVS
jgi:hypothetical protein